MFSAIPDTIWSLRSVIDAYACSVASSIPASRATPSAIQMFRVRSAATIPKKAPTSIDASRAMFVTPLRSVTTPPSAAKAMGAASRSVAAATLAPTSISQVTRWPPPACARAGG